MTMGILSVIVTFAIAYNLAGTYKMPKLNAGMTSLVMFLIAAAPSSYYQLADESVLQAVPCTYLGAQGLFTAIIVALVSVEVTRFCQTKGITIKMPDGVPPFLSETFGCHRAYARQHPHLLWWQPADPDDRSHAVHPLGYREAARCPAFRRS